MINPSQRARTFYPSREQEPPFQQASIAAVAPPPSPLPSSTGSSAPPLRFQLYRNHRVPTEASLFSEDKDPSGICRVYFRAAGDLVLPPYMTKWVPI